MNRPRYAVNIILPVAAAAAWIIMTLFYHEEALSENGLSNLKYFTIQSNFFVGAVSVLWLVRTKRYGEAGRFTEMLKYISAAAVMLTFITVMAFLGPLYGYAMMLSGPNLFLHLLIPLAAAAEFVFMSDIKLTRRETLLSLIPELLYAVFYLSNIAINGIGEWPDTNDWYLFLKWGFGVGTIIFVCITLVMFLIGLVLRKLQTAVSSRRSSS